MIEILAMCRIQQNWLVPQTLAIVLRCLLRGGTAAGGVPKETDPAFITAMQYCFGREVAKHQSTEMSLRRPSLLPFGSLSGRVFDSYCKHISAAFWRF